MILRKEERPVALVALVVFVLLNAMLIYNHYDSFTRGAHVGFWSVFYNHLGMSGYDVFSLIFISACACTGTRCAIRCLSQCCCRCTGSTIL